MPLVSFIHRSEVHLDELTTFEIEKWHFDTLPPKGSVV
jgi:hypothetical protein